MFLLEVYFFLQDGMLDLENTPMLLSLTSPDRPQNLLTTTAWLSFMHFLWSTIHIFSSRGGGKKKKATNNTGQLKRKKGDGRGVGINYLVAHNWEGKLDRPELWLK